MATPDRSRRSVIRTLTLSLASAAGLWRFLTPRAAPGRGPALSVPLSDVPVNGALVLPAHRCAVVRHDGGVAAVDLSCTHLGCTVTGTAQGFVCPCHGSRFGCTGAVEQGPASRALRRLAAEVRGDLVDVGAG